MKLGAAGVLEDDRLPAWVDVVVAPFLQCENDRTQVSAGVGQVILVARRVLGGHASLKYADLLEPAKTGGQHVAWSTGEGDEVLEADIAVSDLAHDKQ